MNKFIKYDYSCINGHYFNEENVIEKNSIGVVCPHCWPNGFLKKIQEERLKSEEKYD